MGSKALKKNDFRRSISTSAGRHPIFTTHRNRTSISTEDRFPKSALTPISRLKKFQKLRDRNLRKSVLGKTARKSIMMETVSASSTTAPLESGKSSPKKVESTNSSPLKMENGGLNGIPEESPIVENGHHNGHENGLKEEEVVTVRRSPRKSEVKEDIVTLHDAETEDESEGEFVDERPLKVLHVKEGRPPSPAPASKRQQREEEGESSSDRDDYVPYPSTRNIRIAGRPPIARESLKRKAHDIEPISDENSPKKMAYTPSISSPGWKFFSSPFTKFWPSQAPCEDDSLVVNLSTDSGATEEPSSVGASLFNDTDMTEEEEEPIEKPSRDPPQKGWSCSVM